MEQEVVSGTDWNDWEIDLIVADYFDMLGFELRNGPFVKSQRNAALQQATGRSRGSIEFKHPNISAVLTLPLVALVHSSTFILFGPWRVRFVISLGAKLPRGA